jgi:hypothetical protein
MLNNNADLFHTLFANPYLYTLKNLHMPESFIKDFVNVLIFLDIIRNIRTVWPFLLSRSVFAKSNKKLIFLVHKVRPSCTC